MDSCSSSNCSYSTCFVCRPRWHVSLFVAPLSEPSGASPGKHIRGFYPGRWLTDRRSVRREREGRTGSENAAGSWQRLSGGRADEVCTGKALGMGQVGHGTTTGKQRDNDFHRTEGAGGAERDKQSSLSSVNFMARNRWAGLEQPGLAAGSRQQWVAQLSVSHLGEAWGTPVHLCTGLNDPADCGVSAGQFDRSNRMGMLLFYT